MLMHFIQTSLDDLHNDIDVFASCNMQWITKVGCDFFAEEDVAPDVYIKEIISGAHKFDAMAILLACISHNIHAMVLLQKLYWTTRAANEHAMTFIKLAYVGQGVYKFIVPLDAQTEKQAEEDAVNNNVQKENNDESDLEKDLAETRLLPTEESSDEGDSTVNHSREHDFDGENVESHSDARDTMDVDKTDQSADQAQDSVSNTSSMDIDNTDQSAENAQEPLQKTSSTDTSSETKTSEDSGSSDEDAGYVSDGSDGDSDVKFVRISVPAKPVATIVSKVSCSCSYKCYLCGFSSELQVTFIQHFATQHPGQLFKCDFCDGMFQTCNGLFKHKRSRQYMRYQCDLCGHRMQFLYQMKAHYKVHSHSDLVQCDLCDRKFACKSSKVAYQNTHMTKLYCDQCKPCTSKVYTHVCGKHGEGWTAPCGGHFRWKSKYTRHINLECTKCRKMRVQEKIKHYPFTKKIKKEKVS